MKYPKRNQYKPAKSPYRIRNWPEYEAGLRRCGDVTFRFGRPKDSCYRWQRSSTRFRYKTIIGRSMRSRTFGGQRVEVQLARKILNTMTLLGMPDGYRVE